MAGEFGRTVVGMEDQFNLEGMQLDDTTAFNSDATSTDERLRLLIQWDTTGDDDSVYWAGLGRGFDGQGWTVDHEEAIVFESRDEANAELAKIKRGVSPARARRITVEDLDE